MLNRSNIKPLINRVFSKNSLKDWWPFFAVLIFIYAFHLHASHQKLSMIESLKANIEELTIRKEKAIQLQDHLKCLMESKHDPDWVRMILIKELGMVPKGAVKVHFDVDDTTMNE